MNVLFRVGLALPVDQDPIVDAGLWVYKESIKAIGPWEKVKKKFTGQQIVETKNQVVTPGFVNCHAHLELTSLRAKVPYKGEFLQWGQNIMSHRRGWSSEDLKNSVAEGLKELVDGGCTTVADYSSQGQSFAALKKSKIRGFGYYEVLGFDAGRVAKEKIKIKKFLSRKSSRRFVRALAVHAPYSVHPDLIKWCFKQKVPLSIHLSELKEEVDFTEKNSANNPFGRLHRSLGRTWQAPGVSPVNYVKNLGAKKITGVHLNYLRLGDLDHLQEMKASAIFCPHSHQFFSHRRHPLLRLRRSGIPVGLGTDSCASNRYCDIRKEMKLLRQSYKSLRDSDILRMATLEGAQALNMHNNIGSLSAGKKADLLFFTLSADPKQSLKRIVNNCPSPTAMICDGQWVKPL